MLCKSGLQQRVSTLDAGRKACSLETLIDMQARENVTVRWDVGLNRKKLAFFTIPRDEVQLRLAPGMQHSKRHTAWHLLNLEVDGPCKASQMLLCVSR